MKSTNELIGNAGARDALVAGADGAVLPPVKMRPGVVKCAKARYGGGNATTPRHPADGYCRFVTTFLRGGHGRAATVVSRSARHTTPAKAWSNLQSNQHRIVRVCYISTSYVRRGQIRVKPGQGGQTHEALNQPLSPGFQPKSHLAKCGQTASVAVRASSANSSADFPQYLTSHPV